MHQPQDLPAAAEAEPSPFKVLVVAGEVSGDQHTAGVVRALLKRMPEASVFGMGGSHLRSAGMETVVDSEKSASVMGLTEVIGSARKIVRAFRTLVAAAESRRPNVALLVDFPDFNLRLAKALHARGIPVLYFISPQLWAWRRSRVNQIKRYVDKVLPIFPFEEGFYHQHQVKAEYVGHPFMDRPALDSTPEIFLREIGLDPARPTVALLPGSRKSEVERLLPEMAAAFTELKRRRPDLQAVLPVAETLNFKWVEEMLGESGVRAIRGRAREVLASGTVGVVASGTATVEAALSGIPFVVVYRLSSFTYWIARRLVRGVDHVGMVNLIAGKKVVQELLQEEASAANIAAELELLLSDAARTAEIKRGLATVGERLSCGVRPGESCGERVAAAIMEYRPAPRVPEAPL